MKLRFLQGRYQGRLVDLVEAGFSIGREEANDLTLDAEGVSRRHCRIFFENDQWWIEDLGSTNGVRVNGARISGRRVLAPGDRIGICNQLFLFAADDAVVEPPPVANAPARETRKVASDPRDAAAVRGESAAVPAAMGGSGPAESGAMDAAAAADSAGAAPFPWGRAVVALVLLAGAIVLLRLSLRTPPTPSGREAAGSSAVPAAANPHPPKRLPGDKRAENRGSAAEGSAAGNRAAAPVLEPPTTPLPPVKPEQLFGKKAAQAASGSANPAKGASKLHTETGAPAVRTPQETSTTPATPHAAGPGEAGGRWILSDPEGATVYVDGRQVGVTPWAIAGLAPGRHELRLTHPGYESRIYRIHLPDVLPAEPLALRLKPGALRIVSRPPGAAVMKGTQILGYTPLVLENPAPGKYEFKLFLPGCKPAVVRGMVDEHNGTTIQAALVPVVGTVVVTTLPAGCRVSVDGDFKGVTVPAGRDTARSAEFRVTGLIAGEHLVTVEHAMAGKQQRRVAVVAGKDAPAPFQFWIPDHRVTLIDGSVFTGMLVEKLESGGVVFADRPGRLRKFLAAQLVRMEKLPETAVRALLARPGRRAPGPRRPRPGGGSVPAKNAAPAQAPPAVEARELHRVFRETSGIVLDKRYSGKPLIIHGVPTEIRREGSVVVIHMGRELHFRFEHPLSHDELRALNEAHSRGREIQVSGTVEGFRGGILTLKNCRILHPEGREPSGARAPQ